MECLVDNSIAFDEEQGEANAHGAPSVGPDTDCNLFFNQSTDSLQVIRPAEVDSRAIAEHAAGGLPCICGRPMRDRERGCAIGGDYPVTHGRNRRAIEI